MDTSELRIGNYINFELEGKYLPAFITMISPMYVETDFICLVPMGLSYHQTDVRIDYIEPIRLTKKWLVKLGAASTELSPAKNGIWITTEIDKQGCWVVISHGTGVVVVCIQYVHQLQNLYYALTGEELQSSRLEKPGA